MTGLTSYLQSLGFHLTREPSKKNDGYMSPLQRGQFTKQLSSLGKLEKIAEIGFNAGLSAEMFFETCSHLKIFTAFDLNCYPCTRLAADYFYQKYPEKFVLVQGDSLETVPEISEKFPKLKFDLIYIDGCHMTEWAIGDILNAGKIAHEGTILWIDDLDQKDVAAAVRIAEDWGHIKVEEHFVSSDMEYGKRHWIQAKIVL